jgi:hypothetical protein
MPKHDKIKLWFIKDAQGFPVLTKTELTTTEGAVAVAQAAKRDEVGDFVWDLVKGKPRLLALALVRAARLTRQEGETDGATCRLLRIFVAEKISSESRRCAETQLYDLSTYKECDWLAAILSARNDWLRDARPRFMRWFRFHNIRGKDSTGNPSVDLDTDHLRPNDVTIAIDGNVVGAQQIDWLEGVLAANIDLSFPPIVTNELYRTAGFMPSVGPAFGHREQELGELNASYADLDCSLIEIVAESGYGKTALARWWIRSLQSSLSQRGMLLFSWSFPRQGRTDGTRQSLSAFFLSLGRALHLAIAEDATPQDLADSLLEGLRQTPTLLFFDGVETLLDQLGQFSIGKERGQFIEDKTETTFHYDSLLYFLRGIVQASDRIAFVLVTTREAISPILNVTPPKARQILLQAYPGLEYLADDLDERPEIGEEPLPKAGEELQAALRRAKLKSKVRDEGFDYRMTKFPHLNVSLRIKYLVRKSLETFGTSAERCLLYVASCFDRPADWDAVMFVINSKEGAAALTVPWLHLNADNWQDVFENLVAANLVLPSGGGQIALHPNVQFCVYEDFRKGMPEACAEVHRRLYSYFVAVPKKELPDSVEEMEPLFRACWHGCNAGDFQRTFTEIAYNKISRKWQAYIIFHLGAYEEALQMLNLFTEDGETFPASDLDDERRATIIHGCALCLRYVDRLNEAYRVEKIAWAKCNALRSKPQQGPIAANLLRLHHIFGDLGIEVEPLLWALLRSALPGLGASAQKEDIPRELLPQAVGYVAGIAALVQACRDRKIKARAILVAANNAARRLFDSKHQFIMPGIGAVHHALALLELGEWRTVLNGINCDELTQAMPRYHRSGAVFYIAGRAIGESSKEKAVQEKALIEIEKCLAKAKGNFKWWQAAALEEQGKINLRLHNIGAARSAFSDELKIAAHGKNQFKLLEINALLGLAECDSEQRRFDDARALAKRALTRLSSCGYQAKRLDAERLLRE